MASTLAAVETGLYLYGITAPQRPLACPAGGVAGADVESIAEDRVVAVVSRLGPVRLRPQRANLAAHHRILRDLGQQQPVLPVAFGTIVGSEEELRRILRKNREALARLLERLRGKVEMGLKVFWDLPNVFDYFVATHQELEHLRNRLFRPGRAATLEQKVELGELFVSLLQQARQRHTQRVKEALAPYSAQVASIDPGDERMIMKLACLVEKDRQQQWEEGVGQAAQLFDDHYRFDYSGPWPPYNFVDIDLELD